MSTLTNYKIFKETTLPGTLQPHAIYLVAPAAHPTYVEIYVTNAAGSATRRTHKVEDIQAMIDSSLAAAASGATIVDTITARNAISSPKNGQTVLVIDASADSTVTTGAATYVWRSSNSTWVKISEYESMDITQTWDALTGKPTSTVASIDLAVTNSHTHTNKTQLDKVGENASALFTYNGQLPKISWDSTNW
jgi:hypothetical protein